MAEHLLVSDLDGTLLGDDEALERFAEWYRHSGSGLQLVYASGRLFDSAADTIRTTALPDPAAVITGVGTSIRDFPSGESLDAWPAGSLARWSSQRVRQTVSAFADLRLQPSEFQTKYKVSYYVDDATDDWLDRLWQELWRAAIDADVIYSSNRDLDVVPRAINKGTAAAFLASCWDLQAEQVIVSGDSGNDIALFAHGFRGVVVANAHDELKRLDSSSVYHASRPFAAGVLEGLQYWLGKHRQGSDRRGGAEAPTGPGSRRTAANAAHDSVVRRAHDASGAGEPGAGTRP